MSQWLNSLGWVACVVYATIPSFWLMIHPFAERWREQRRSPYRLILPVWILWWIVVGAITWKWRHTTVYASWWSWFPAVLLFACGFWLYGRSKRGFSREQLYGLPEIQGRHGEQRLVTSGIRSRVRHPVYLAHLCEMLAWSAGTGLTVCFGLTAFAVATGAVMIRMEEAELEARFGDAYRQYKKHVPAILPALTKDQP